MAKLKESWEQLHYLVCEISQIVNQRWWRWFTCWFGSSAGVIASYRLDRFFYLIFGDIYPFVRVVFFPIFIILRILSFNHEISYRAEIGKGLSIMHPSLGVVISGYAVIGSNLALAG